MFNRAWQPTYCSEVWYSRIFRKVALTRSDFFEFEFVESCLASDFSNRKPLLRGQILSNHDQLLSNIKQPNCCFATNIEDQVALAAILIVLVLKDEEI